MRSIIGSIAPLMPMTGYFNSRDEELEWTEGNLENWNAYYTLRGIGEIHYEKEILQTGVGDLLLLAPGVHRSYRIANPRLGWEFYWLHFRATPRLKNTLNWFDRSKIWQKHLLDDVSLRVHFAARLEEAHQINLCNPDLPCREAMLEALLEALFLRLAGAEQQRVRTHSIDTRIEKALELFHRDIAAETNVNLLAAYAGLSRSQFCMLFRKGTGRTPQQYIEERRLEMAAYYLRTTAQAIAEVAEMVGFQNAFYFTNRFRRRFGLNPTHYRGGKQK